MNRKNFKEEAEKTWSFQSISAKEEKRLLKEVGEELPYISVEFETIAGIKYLRGGMNNVLIYLTVHNGKSYIYFFAARSRTIKFAT